MPDAELENLLADCERNLKSSNAAAYLEAMKRLKTFGEPAIPFLLSAARGSDAKVSAAGLQALGEMEGVGTLALRDLLYAEIKVRRKRDKLNPILICTWAVAFVAAICLQNIFGDDRTMRSFFGHLMGIVSTLTGVMIVSNRINVRRSILSALQQTNDIKQIGLFALCINENDAGVRSIAKNALTRLLPKTQASDSQHLTSDEMQALIDAIRRQKDYPTFMLALLKGLEQIGDERALPNVEALTRDPYIFPAVRQAAWDCLPYLQIRAEQAEQAQTLLRASSGSEISPGTLLRPAQGVSTSSNDAQELLRPKL